MPSQTNEQALEAAIERTLTGTCLEELKAAESPVREAAAVYDPAWDIILVMPMLLMPSMPWT